MVETHTIPMQFHPRAFSAFGSDLVTNDYVAVNELIKKFSSPLSFYRLFTGGCFFCNLILMKGIDIMPKATFNDFVNSSAMLKGFAGNKDAEKIFDIIYEGEQIYGAILTSENGKPALLSSVKKIEEHVERNPDSNFPMTDFNKQAIGKMQKFILEPFGYVPNGKQKTIRSNIFSTASCYRYENGTATMRIKVTSEEI